MTMKHILLVGRAREILAKARQFDLRFTQLFKLRSDMVSENLEPYHRLVGLPADAGADEWVAQARLIHSIDPVDAVGAFTETAEKIAARVALALGLPYLAPEVITGEAPVDFLRYCATLDEACDWLSERGFPFTVDDYPHYEFLERSRMG